MKDSKKLKKNQSKSFTMKTACMSIGQHLVYILLGTCSWVFIGAIVILSLPLYLYRWITTEIVAPIVRGNVGKAVCVTGQVFATEFANAPKRSSRHTILSSIVVEGHLTLDEIFQRVDEKWVQEKAKSGKLKYPEVQQYMEMWMGIMFWRQDEEFDLKNHIKLLQLDPNEGDLESELFLCQFGDKLLNAPYTSKRSPWEAYVVHNYKNSSLLKERGYPEGESRELTLCVLRAHHAMGDGFAFLSLFLEQLLGCSLEDACVPLPTFAKKLLERRMEDNLVSCLTLPPRLIYDLGHFLTFFLKTKTPFHIPDDKKMWSQHYGRVPLIPVSKIKYVKDAFKVSFGSVINSAFAAAVGKTLVKLLEPGSKLPTEIVLGNPVPKPNHPKTLSLHVYFASFEIPVSSKMHPVDRLRECEQRGREVVSCTIPILCDIMLKIFCSHFAYFGSFVTENRFLGVAMTNFPGPGIELYFNNKRGLAMDFAAGGMKGYAGLVLSVLSYSGKVQITATAEKGVMPRREFDDFLADISKEIDVLYELAVLEIKKEELHEQKFNNAYL